MSRPSSAPRLALLALGLLSATAGAQAPRLRLQPTPARPGDPVLVTVTGLAGEPSGTLDGRPLRFYAAGDGFQALTSLPVEQAPGAVPVKVTAGESPALEAALEVRAAEWRERTLRVAGKYTEPPPEVQARLAEDRAAFASAFGQAFHPPLFTRNFAWPREARVTAPFGDRRTFNGQVQSQHFGTDLDGKTGAPILCANDGVVVMSRDNYAAGGTVLVHHGGGLYTSYFHMSRIDVKQGEAVKLGQRLGLVGRTGRVTGPHLHWGAKVDERWVDPEALLKLDFFGTPAAPVAEGGAPVPPPAP
ncbi:M23 family metallopeptidase [Myxococcaceae bacterium GXIMD 01537]